ncbi:MAG: hypothetical protein ACI8SK_001263 [Shewanella sp.]
MHENPVLLFENSHRIIRQDKPALLHLNQYREIAVELKSDDLIAQVALVEKKYSLANKHELLALKNAPATIFSSPLYLHLEKGIQRGLLRWTPMVKNLICVAQNDIKMKTFILGLKIIEIRCLCRYI